MNGPEHARKFESASLSGALMGALMGAAAIALVLSGCGGAGKKSDGGARGASDSRGERSSGEEPSFDGLDGEGQADAVAGAKAPGGIDTNFKGRSLDGRYSGLAQAVRSGKVEPIYSEASKILSSNQYDPIALNALALQYFRRGKAGAAKLLLNKALERNPPSAALMNNLAVINMAEGEQELAALNLKKALRLDDHHVPALGNLGSIYAAGGDWGKARPLLEEAYRANRSNVAVATNYAIVLRGAKDFDGAERVYKDVLAKDSKNAPALLNYAILLIDYMNKPKDGLQYVYKLKFLDPDKKEIVLRANALEKKAQSEVK